MRPSVLRSASIACSSARGAAVSQSGAFLAVGAFLEGAFYLYRVEDNGTATYLSKALSPEGPSSHGSFGKYLSLSDDLLVVGAVDAGTGGAAYLYQVEANGSSTYLAKLEEPQTGKYGAAVSASGDLVAVGARASDSDGQTNAGAVYLYRLEENGSVTPLPLMLVVCMMTSSRDSGLVIMT